PFSSFAGYHRPSEVTHLPLRCPFGSPQKDRRSVVISPAAILFWEEPEVVICIEAAAGQKDSPGYPEIFLAPTAMERQIERFRSRAPVGGASCLRRRSLCFPAEV